MPIRVAVRGHFDCHRKRAVIIVQAKRWAATVGCQRFKSSLALCTGNTRPKGFSLLDGGGLNYLLIRLSRNPAWMVVIPYRLEAFPSYRGNYFSLQIQHITFFWPVILDRSFDHHKKASPLSNCSFRSAISARNFSWFRIFVFSCRNRWTSFATST